MKRVFYLFLMTFLFMMVFQFVYLALIVVLVRYGVIPLRNIVEITDILLSSQAHLLVGVLSGLAGFIFGLRWWQIIYVDGVYYFDKRKKRDSRRRIIKKAPVEPK